MLTVTVIPKGTSAESVEQIRATAQAAARTPKAREETRLP